MCISKKIYVVFKKILNISCENKNNSIYKFNLEFLVKYYTINWYMKNYIGYFL